MAKGTDWSHGCRTTVAGEAKRSIAAGVAAMQDALPLQEQQHSYQDSKSNKNTPEISMNCGVTDGLAAEATARLAATTAAAAHYILTVAASWKHDHHKHHQEQQQQQHSKSRQLMATAGAPATAQCQAQQK